jgi:hypothetical protein
MIIALNAIVAPPNPAATPEPMHFRVGPTPPPISPPISPPDRSHLGQRAPHAINLTMFRIVKPPKWERAKRRATEG